jgi:hypothetical protein
MAEGMLSLERQHPKIHLPVLQKKLEHLEKAVTLSWVGSEPWTSSCFSTLPWTLPPNPHPQNPAWKDTGRQGGAGCRMIQPGELMGRAQPVADR